MLPYNNSKGVKSTLLITGVILLAVSSLSDPVATLFFYRLVRVLICFSFFGLMLFFKKDMLNPYLAGFLVLYGISGITIIWYENHIFATLSMFLNFLAYACFTKTLLPKINFKKMNIFFSIGFGVLVLVLLYLLYSFIDMIDGFTLTIAHYLFILLFAISFVSAGFFTLLYNHTFSTKTTFLFTLCVFLLIFSEVFSAIGYYDLGMGNVAAYISRGLLIVGSGSLVYYSSLKIEENETLYSKVF